jgi:hypothetical protein
MTALADFSCQYVEVPRRRGQQLKDVAQLDPWVRDGSAAEISETIEYRSSSAPQEVAGARKVRVFGGCP